MRLVSPNKMHKNTLYVVGLPIGNLDDITFRALEILKKVSCIYAEDTRQFLKFSKKFNIETSVKIYEDHNERTQSHSILYKLLKEAPYDVALVSDAGTPLLSDPGYHLIKQCYENNIPVVPIPGVSAITCGLSVAPFNSCDFRFVGFFENKKLNTIVNSSCTILFFESPRRINRTLAILQPHLEKRKILIGREMTKEFEEFIYFSNESIPPISELGEMVVIIEGRDTKQEFNINYPYIKSKFAHISNRDLCNIITCLTHLPKKEVYNRILQVDDIIVN